MTSKFLVLCVSALCGCSSGDNHSGGDAANVPSGSGGSSVGAGGMDSSSGGAVVGGGGAMVGSGGTVVGAGGAMVGSGGATVGNGGTAGGGAAGGVAQGGQTGTLPRNDVSRSMGCGTTAPATGNLTIDVGGTSRQYILAIPSNYDKSTAYRLIFAWHGLGGSAAQVASNWYGLKSLSNNGAIFVAGQGLQTTTPVGSGAGWANANGEDLAFVKALYATLQGELCFDQNRTFSVGMSYGGIMSDLLGCQMGDVFRAIAPMSGEGPGGTCKGQVAVWMSNGDNDNVVPTAAERASRDFWVAANHCQKQSKAVDPSPCLAYDGCDTGYPVTWCEFAGGHTIPSFSPSAIWKFFSQF